MNILLTFIIFQYLNCTLSLENNDEVFGIYRRYVDEVQKTRIVGGRDSDTKKFPFMVSIQFPKHHFIHRCGGTLINSLYVLTAAHCFPYFMHLEEYRIVAGISDMDDIDVYLLHKYSWEETKRQNNFYGQKSGVNIIVVYYDYDSLSYVNDIAIMQLTNPIVSSAAVGFVNLPTHKYTEHPSKTLKDCTVLGWGIQTPMISMDKPYYNFTGIRKNVSSMLQCLELPIINNTMCNYFLQNFAKYKTVSSQVCTLYGPGGKDACYGDSGGPLLCNRIQLGITSTGWGCGLPNRPAVFTRTDFFLDWIRQNSVVKDYNTKKHSSNTAMTSKKLPYYLLLYISSFIIIK